METLKILGLFVFGTLLVFAVIGNLTHTQKSREPQSTSHNNANYEFLQQQNLIAEQENLINLISAQEVMKMHMKLNGNMHHTHVEQNHLNQKSNDLDNQNNFPIPDTNNTSTTNVDNSSFSDSTNF